MVLRERRLEIGAGLGDCLATLPACYALAAEGQRTEVACLQPGGGELYRTDALPTLRLFGEGRVSPEASRLEFWSRTDWGSTRPIFDQVARILGTVIRDTPRTALLQQLPDRLHQRGAGRPGGRAEDPSRRGEQRAGAEEEEEQGHGRVGRAGRETRGAAR